MNAIKFALALLCSGSALAQLPATLPSDLGADVPAFRVRPGYRVTRALPAKLPQLRDARFIEFSGYGKVPYADARRCLPPRLRNAWGVTRGGSVHLDIGCCGCHLLLTKDSAPFSVAFLKERRANQQPA